MYLFSDDDLHTSVIDHILEDQVQECDVVNVVDNISDHCGIKCSFKFDIECCITKKSGINSQCTWGSATPDDIINYQNCLNTYLHNACVDPVLTQCDSYMCKEHDTLIGDLYSNIVNAIVDAGVTAIPQSNTETMRSSGVKATPGWNEYVEPKRQVSLFWHNMWKDRGCPHHGVVADIMRNTRA